MQGLNFKDYRIVNNRVIITLMPLLAIGIFGMFVYIDGHILSTTFELGYKGFLYVAGIISLSIIPSIFYILYCTGKFFNIQLKPFRVSFKDINPHYNIWISYSMLYYMFFVDSILVTFMPIKYCGIIGQVSFCIAFLLLGNATTHINYAIANVGYMIIAMIGSICANKFTPETWLPWGSNLVYLPEYMTIPTVILLMLAITVLNRMAEVSDIQNWKNVRQLEYTNIHDPLTGAFNRQMLKPELFKDHFIIMFDIDFFKRVNDTFNHEMGDKVLKKVVEIVKASIRDDDILIRYGGEEFIILVDGESNKKDVHEFADRIRKDVEEQTLVTEDVDDPNYICPVTISMGVGYVDPKFTFEENIKVADEFLYEAKKGGRNKVVSVLNSDKTDTWVVKEKIKHCYIKLPKKSTN